MQKLLICLCFASLTTLLHCGTIFNIYISPIVSFIPLSNINYTDYIEVQVGTPAQKVYMLIDNNACISWIPSSAYNSSVSSSTNLSQTYQNYTISSSSYLGGYLASDYFSIPEIQINEVMFKFFYAVNENGTPVSQKYGVLGFSPDPSCTQNIFTKAQEIGQLNNAVIGLEISPDKNVCYIKIIAYQVTSKLYMSFENFPKNLNFSWINQTNNTNWKIPINSLKVDGITENTPNQSIIISSQTSPLFLSTNAYQAVIQNVAIISYCSQSQGYYLCPCINNDVTNQYPDIQIEFGDINNLNITISSSDYLIPLSGSGTYCILGIYENKNPLEANTMLFGDTFMQTMFFAFDKQNQLLGLAK